MPDNAKIKQELNQKTLNSNQFAVVVMSNEDKVEARKRFQTLLLFSVQEAKGLEYENIILPEFRKKRQYLNSILSKNEIDGVDPYNKKLFLRISRGIYVLNPDLEILVAENQWMNVYDMMFTEKMTCERNEAIIKEELVRFYQQLEEQREKARAKEEAERKRRMEEWDRRWRW